MAPPASNIDINVALSVAQSTTPAPPTRKQRRRAAQKTKISRLSDLQAWELDDAQISAADRANCKSDVYNHFNSELVRHTRTISTESGEIEVPDYMEYVFTCKDHPEEHTIRRRREDIGRGTGNFHSSIATCHRRYPPTEQQSLPTTGRLASAYSYTMHLAIIVMACAYHYLPFARVLDKLFRRQVDLLRPGTLVPDSSTISRTTRFVYEQQACKVKSYFQGIDTVHLAIDGWTSPNATAYLGLVVHWYTKGHLWRVVLEFIRLEAKHTGVYLAEKTAECLQRYGLEGKVLAVCLDNASSNDKLVQELPQLLPGFLGKLSRTRCAAHVINLIVKAFTSHFVKPPVKKRKASNSKKVQKRRRTSKSAVAVISEEEIDDIGNDTVPDTVARLAQIEDDGADLHNTPMDEIDEARQQHDERVITEVTADGIRYVNKQLGLAILESTRAWAQGVLTKAGKLARKLHDSPSLQAKFEKLIDASSQHLLTLRRALARRMPTRWNTDYECLLSHKELKPCVEMLTAESVNDLRELALDDGQWSLLEQLVRVLKIFKEATDLFSRSEVPMVHEVVPIFVRMRRRLELVRDNTSHDLHPLIRAAAHSSLLVYDKYMGLFTESEIYWISLVMCPDRKLQWLLDNGWLESDKERVYDMVVARFYSFNTPLEVQSETSSQTPGNSDEDDWFLGNDTPKSNSLPSGSIEAYLRSAPLSVEAIQLAGGPVRYWESQMLSGVHSSVAKFALNYLSAPAASVDVERAFSCGRLMTNHLQHQMSSDTFCAKMAIRSWYETPLLPDVEDVAALLNENGGEDASIN